MRLASFPASREFDELYSRFFGSESPPTRWTGGSYDVPTDIFHLDGRLVIRMDLPGVSADDVEVTVQENTLLINGKRDFPYDAATARWMRRGSFYGEFTQRVSLGRGLDVGRIAARYDNGVLELTIPYTEEVQPKKIDIEVGSGSENGRALTN